MLTLLRIMNVVLLLALVGCIAGTLAGLIVFVPFIGGAWLLNAVALAGCEEAERPGWTERVAPDNALEALAEDVPAAPRALAPEPPTGDDAPDDVDALPATGII